MKEQNELLTFAVMKDMIFTVMPMFVCLFWSIMLVFDVRIDGTKHPRLHLLVFMLTATVLYFGHCVFFNHSTHLIPVTDTLYSIANLLVYPLYFLYICALTTRGTSHRLHYTLLIPAIAGGLLVGTGYVMMSEEETRLFIDTYLYHGQHEGLQGAAGFQAFAHDFCKVQFAILIFPTFVLGRKYLWQYEQLLENTYADTEQKSLDSVRYMLYAFILTSTASFIVNIIGRDEFDQSPWLLSVPSTLFSILLFTVGYMGHRQQFYIGDIEADEQMADEQMLNQPFISDLRQQIEQLMDKEQLFKQPNLKIVDLVQRLGTNRSYIYQAINREMGISFNEYVNRMRIEYASLLISLHPDMPLSEVAEQSGFTSSTSFYRNFKLYKGTTPLEYLKSLKVQ